MKRCLLTATLAVASFVLLANNIAVRNVLLGGVNSTNQYTLIKFDLSWDNSWRVNTGPTNWDAAWVFAKYRIKGQTSWHHATLHWVDGSGSGDGHTVPAGATISSSNDNSAGGAYGVFIYHNTPMGQGSVSYTGAQLRWDYGVDGAGDADLVEIRVYAIEMVYVPQGSYYLGTGGPELGAFYTYPDVTQPYHVTSEDEIPLGAVMGQLYYKPNVYGDYTGPVPATFPKGYQAFYCMKYETTQDQYVAFLNTLDSSQAFNLVQHATNNRAIRSGITPWTADHPLKPGDYGTTNPDVPVTMSFDDLAAYLDWAALRPLSELEFEKACRGTLAPVPNEFAWGTNTVVNFDPVRDVVSGNIPYGLTNAGTANEFVDTNYSLVSGNATWNYTYDRNNPIVRAGAFAANPANSGRVTSGATYYGIMEMSGNMVDPVISIGYAGGRIFTGHPGNGKLDAGGYADENWPNASNGHSGAGFRGGYYRSPFADLLMVSDRESAADYITYVGNLYPGGGGRGARTAP